MVLRTLSARIRPHILKNTATFLSGNHEITDGSRVDRAQQHSEKAMV